MTTDEELKSRKGLIEGYESIAPSQMLIEDIDGSYYPKEIELPDVAYIPSAEPRALITDLYENPQEWYYIGDFIKDLAEQAFVAYYKGLYQASFLTSVTCVELTLKYEYIRNKLMKPKDLEGMTGLGKLITTQELKKIKLEKHALELDSLNKARNGLLHFNPKKLKEATIKILLDKKPPKGVTLVDVISGKGIVESSQDPEDAYHIPTDNWDDWSRFAYFAYSLMYKITSQLYGEKQKHLHIKAGLDDYHDKKMERR